MALYKGNRGGGDDRPVIGAPKSLHCPVPPRRYLRASRHLFATVAICVLALVGNGAVHAAPALADTASTSGAPSPASADNAAPESTIGGPQLESDVQLTYNGAPALPASLDVDAFVIADATSGQVLAAQDPHGHYSPATALSTLTFLALYPLLDPDQTLTATINSADITGTRIGLVDNGQYTVDSLWSALLLQSAADAAQVLADAAGGDAATVALMNSKAAELQAHDTDAGDSALPNPTDQVSSAYDLALFMREIVQHPDMRSIAGMTTASITANSPTAPTVYFNNDNDLVTNYPGAIAGIAGKDDANGDTYVAAAQRDGRTLIVTMIGAKDSSQLPWQQGAALLDWGFAAPADASGPGTLVNPMSSAPTDAPQVTNRAHRDEVPGSVGAAASSIPLTTWPLIPVLAVLLLVAIWIAGPRKSNLLTRLRR